VKTDIQPQIATPIKPTNHGRFSPDRDAWEEIHRRRYTQWQLGASVDEIAADESVTSKAVRHSLDWCEGRLPKAEVINARATRLRLRAFSQLAEKYVDELQSLMEDPNPLIRLKALEAFRRTTGLETSGGVNVNVSQQTAVVTNGDAPRTFEALLTRVRATVCAPTASREE